MKIDGRLPKNLYVEEMRYHNFEDDKKIGIDIKKFPSAYKMYRFSRKVPWNSFNPNLLHNSHVVNYNKEKLNHRYKRDSNFNRVKSTKYLERETNASSESNKQASDDENSEQRIRREIFTMNLNVLRQLSRMLGEERAKYLAEKQMLRASRNMMIAETRKILSEREKLNSEKQKIDLEKDILQSQILGRKDKFS